MSNFNSLIFELAKKFNVPIFAIKNFDDYQDYLSFNNSISKADCDLILNQLVTIFKKQNYYSSLIQISPFDVAAMLDYQGNKIVVGPILCKYLNNQSMYKKTKIISKIFTYQQFLERSYFGPLAIIDVLITF